MMTPEDEKHDLMLTLIYLSRFIDKYDQKDFWEAKSFRAWKNYDWDTLDKLEKEGLVSSSFKSKSMYITEDGVKKAKEILERLGIRDWQKEPDY